MAQLTTDRDRPGGEIMRSAVRRLADRLPDLADRLVAEIVRGEDRDRPATSREDLWQVAHTGLGFGMEAILDPGRRRTDLEWAERLGRHRAEQGLPLDLLLRSYRLAGKVFWESVVEVVAEDDPAHVPVLVRHATRTWATIDEQSGAVAAAYHRTEYDLLRRSEERTHAVVDALLEGRAEAGLLATATEVLGLPARGRYAVVVLGRQREPGAHRPEGEDGVRILWHTRADGTQAALVALGQADPADLVPMLRPHAGTSAGISPAVETLGEVGTARWLAELALRSCRPGEHEIVLLDRRLPEALLVSQPHLADRLSRTVLGPVLATDAGSREVLLSTLAAWLECDGSAARAASLLYCHHNTVLNRLRRIEKLTGRALANPAHLVELALALTSVQLLETGPPE